MDLLQKSFGREVFTENGADLYRISMALRSFGDGRHINNEQRLVSRVKEGESTVETGVDATDERLSGGHGDVGVLLVNRHHYTLKHY